ncbi:hypothetical protein Q0M94_21390 (plasmid) [Deinococcus radiomollis]
MKRNLAQVAAITPQMMDAEVPTKLAFLDVQRLDKGMPECTPSTLKGHS